MNCIFICVFNQVKYVEMLYLLLQSIYLYGLELNDEMDDDTEILIYTSTEFMNIIKATFIGSRKNIRFEINDTYDNIDKACRARLDLWDLDSVNEMKYKKILYLDTDIIIKGKISKIFDIIDSNVLYVLEEGVIDSPSEWWGNKLFGSESANYNDKSAFTSGILAFNNCTEIKNLFDYVKADIIKRPYPENKVFDQPFIIYGAFKHNLYNNKVLNDYAINNNFNIDSNIIIHHFPGGPGVYAHKLAYMKAFLNMLKSKHMAEIYNNVLNIPKLPNIHDDVWTCSDEMRYDIYNFFNASSGLSGYHIAEIGSHKGYSTRFLSKIFTKVYAVDNSIEFTNFNKNFNKDLNNIEYVILDIYNDSWESISDTVDVVFIDAVHSYSGCKSDIMNSIHRFKNLKYIIFDDYGVWGGVKTAVDEFIRNGSLAFCTYIGLNDVPNGNGVTKGVNEGIICRIN